MDLFDLIQLPVLSISHISPVLSISHISLARGQVHVGLAAASVVFRPNLLVSLMQFGLRASVPWE